MRAPGFPAHELERIGILLLRHHAAAGAERVGQLEEPVLVAAEDDQVLGQPAEVHHRQRAGVEERRGEVAIRRRVDAVGDDAREAEVAGQRVDVDGVARARNRAGAERQRIGFVARPPPGDRSRAGAARRAPGRSARPAPAAPDGSACTPASARRRPRRPAPTSASTTRPTAALQQRDAPPQVQAQVERHLLVARPSGVQPPAGVAEPLDEQPLDEAVHVLVGAVDERRVRRGRARGSRASACSICRASSVVSTPAPSSARAHARLPVTSSSNSRRSKRNDDTRTRTPRRRERCRNGRTRGVRQSVSLDGGR